MPSSWAYTSAAAAIRRAFSGLEPITLHECRHTYVSLMHAASVPLERIGDYVGHSGTYMTERYRHLVEGQGAKDAAGLDEFLNGAHRGAQAPAEGRKRPS